MTKITQKFYFTLTLLLLGLLLVGCSDNATDVEENDSSENTSNEQVEKEVADTEQETEDENQSTLDDTNSDVEDNSVENNTSNESTTEMEQSNDHASEEDSENKLDTYSSEEIEYARVWLQLGPNQDIDELYVSHIPAGTLLNPEEDDVNVSYPEDVIQIRGSRIVDGVVTYSGNGDGTINVYNIPYRWYGGFPRPDDIDKEKIIEERKDIINNTESVYVDPGDDEAVINVIKKISMVD